MNDPVAFGDMTESQMAETAQLFSSWALRGRGRPTITTDDVLVAEAIDLILSGKVKSNLAAARQLSWRANGHSAESSVDRLRTKIAVALQKLEKNTKSL